MRRLQLAYSWGKWLALRRKEYENAMAYYQSQRPRTNWSILVQHDEMACRYQRCRFRIERAERAVGANGLTGYATFNDKEPNAEIELVGVKFPVQAASRDQLAQMNYENFHRHDRMRAVTAKQIMNDKRHPLAAYADRCAEEEREAYEAEMRSAAYGGW